MAYNRQELFNQAIESIATENLFFIEDIVAWLPCDKTTFYRYFPVDEKKDKEQDEITNPEGEKCNGYNYLKASLEQNKIKTKSSLRAKMYDGDSSALTLALYKLICTPEERKALSMQAIDHTTGGEKMPTTIINLGTGTKPKE